MILEHFSTFLKYHIPHSSVYLLGLGNYSLAPEPTLVGGDIAGEKIIHVSSRADCVLAVSGKGPTACTDCQNLKVKIFCFMSTWLRGKFHRCGHQLAAEVGNK